MLQDLLELYAYNRWANERTLASAAELSVEQYTRTIASSFPSLRLTLEHVLRAEIAWFSRWKGLRQGPAPDLVDCTDVSALSARWVPFWAEQLQFLAALAETDLRRPVEIKLWVGTETVQPLADTMRHVVNHSTYHRGQATTLIRQLGGTPVTTDFFTYVLLRDSGQLLIAPA